MFDSQVPSTLLKLYQAVDHTSTEFGKKGYTISMAKNGGEYSFYLCNEHKESILYFGIWYAQWQKYGTRFGFRLTYPYWATRQLNWLSRHVSNSRGTRNMIKAG